jgi:hypothetical protein
MTTGPPTLQGPKYFGSENELAQLAATWPVAGANGRGSSKLIELWNSLPDVTPVKKFKDRTTAWPGSGRPPKP